MDREKGMGVALFHIEADLESLVCLLNMIQYNISLLLCAIL